MTKKIIARIANGFGNQMFFYASVYSFSKKLNYELYLDTFTAINQLKRKNTKKKFKHWDPKFELNILNISSKILSKNLTFDSNLGYFKRKFLIFLDNFYSKKTFYIENINKNIKKSFDINFLDKPFNDKMYIEGYFESEKYFLQFRSELLKEFSFKKKINCDQEYLNNIVNSNSVSLAIRRDRFSETLNDDLNNKKIIKSKLFDKLQIDYINNSIIYFKKKLPNPKFFLFSDNFDGLEDLFYSNENITFVKNSVQNKVIEDFFLMYKCKHFAVAPTSFHWWAAWLNNNDDKICLRPSNDFLNPSNSADFWPDSWIKI
jgi:hypothetical protein